MFAIIWDFCISRPVFKKISKKKHPQKKNIRIDSGGLRVARCGWG